MKIIWNQNPLRTRVELAQEDKEKVYENLFKDNLDWYDTPEEAKEEADRLYPYFIDELESGYMHMGDCTCVATACTKCWAESYLGINTIEGASKDILHAVDQAFRQKGIETTEQAVHWMIQNPPIGSWEGSEKYHDLWRQNQMKAVEWLEEYKKKYLNEGCK